MNKTSTVALLLFVCLPVSAFGQLADTIPFDGTKLKPMKLVYETHVPAADTSQVELTISMTLRLEKAEADGREAWKLDVQGSAHDIDFWDRTTLEAIKRTVTFGGSTFSMDRPHGGVRITIDGDNPESYAIDSQYPLVSDGMLNYFALGTLPLKKGYTFRYNSFVRRKKAILTHEMSVIGDTTAVVPAGSFEAFALTENIVDDSMSDAAVPTWYVMKEAPRLVVRLDAPLPNGVIATVVLVDVK